MSRGLYNHLGGGGGATPTTPPTTLSGKSAGLGNGRGRENAASAEGRFLRSARLGVLYNAGFRKWL